MTTSTLAEPTLSETIASAPAATTGINRSTLFAIVLGHLTVDMQTGSLAVLLPVLLKVFSLDYTGAAAIMSFNNIVIEPRPTQQPHPPLWMGAGSFDGIRVDGEQSESRRVNQALWYQIFYIQDKT